MRGLWTGILLSFVLMNSVFAGSQDYEIIYTGKNSKVILTPSVQHPESELNKYGNTVCGNNKFCVLWFYSNRNDSKVGAEVMKKGDMFAQTPGMYAIYSRNKIVNKIICYEPSSGC